MRGTPAPVAYASTGCGGCGAAIKYAQPVAPAPIVYAQPIAPTTVVFPEPVAPAPITVNTGCGGCGVSSAAVVFAQPVAPAPVVTSWGNECGLGRRIFYAAPAAVAPAPYVADQGPDYSGPGIMVPYKTYSRSYGPSTELSVYPGLRLWPALRLSTTVRGPIARTSSPIARDSMGVCPHYYGPMPRMRPTWHRPLGMRG